MRILVIDDEPRILGFLARGLAAEGYTVDVADNVLAAGKVGVDKVFAMQAGREIRVMVRPEEIDDIGAAVLARDVAKQIEEELTYPGQIRVTVVRESRVTELAR